MHFCIGGMHLEVFTLLNTSIISTSSKQRNEGTNEMAISKKTAETLAVSYRALGQAYDREDWNGVSVWGKMLMEAQTKTGIELYSDQLIKGMIRQADREMEIAA